MKVLSIIAIVVAAVSTILGIISRIMITPFFGALQIEAHAFLQFSSVCLLFAIALGILKLLKK